MSFNTKNRPRFEVAGGVSAHRLYQKQVHKWFEGFEKQERERLRFAEARLEAFDKREGKQEADAMWEKGYILAKKEILGVSPERGKA